MTPGQPSDIEQDMSVLMTIKTLSRLSEHQSVRENSLVWARYFLTFEDVLSDRRGGNTFTWQSPPGQLTLI